MQTNQGQGHGNPSQDVPPKGTPPPSQAIEGEEEDSKTGRTGSGGSLPNQGSQQKSNLVGGGSSRT